MKEASRAGPWQSEADFLAAMADARPGADSDQDGKKCGMYGPGGECVRTKGHSDRFLDGQPIYNHNDHVSYDTDQHVSWECGWKSKKDRLKLALDELLEHHAECHTGCKDLDGEKTRQLLRSL